MCVCVGGVRIVYFVHICKVKPAPGAGEYSPTSSILFLTLPSPEACSVMYMPLAVASSCVIFCESAMMWSAMLWPGKHAMSSL